MPAGHPGVPSVCVSAPLPGAQQALGGCSRGTVASVAVLVGQAGQGPCRCGGWPAQVVVLRGPCCTPRLPQPRPRPGGDSLLPATWLPTLDHHPVRSLDLQPGSASRGPSSSRCPWACWFLLDSHADMLLDLSDLLQVDEPPPTPALLRPHPPRLGGSTGEGRGGPGSRFGNWQTEWVGRGGWRPRGWV